MPLTAAVLIAIRENQIAQAGGHIPLGRALRILRSVQPIIVRDLALPSHPCRSMRFDVMRKSPVVVVRTAGPNRAFVERINLLQADADERLARYELL
jgi:hypothetical protein